MDETHDPARRSWIESANDPASDFPIQNLPFGVFKLPGESRHSGEAGHSGELGRASESGDRWRVGVAIGESVVDVGRLFDMVASRAPATSADERAGEVACRAGDLAPLMGAGRAVWSAVRWRLSGLLATGSVVDSARAIGDRVVVPRADVQLGMPVAVGDYTDFYASVYHATNVGRMFRPDNPLLPNYKYVPIGYHGRASSLILSGRDVRRPVGQIKTPDAESPIVGPTRSLDYEAELGCFVGVGNALGRPVAIADIEAESHFFGCCLVNDWSARDVQSWEYQPLGPFLSKSFATTISPWVVTADALEPYRVAPAPRAAGDPAPLPYLTPPSARLDGLDVTIEVWMASGEMRARGLQPIRLGRSQFRDMYWTFAQMLTHHTMNGCNLRTGDLLGSGTVSGPTADSLGCMLELTKRGAEPVELPTGERRGFLADGDEVVMRGYCEQPGRARIGFGDCRGIVVAT
jgi:fumarylacetoacetase